MEREISGLETHLIVLRWVWLWKAVEQVQQLSCSMDNPAVTMFFLWVHRVIIFFTGTGAARQWESGPIYPMHRLVSRLLLARRLHSTPGQPGMPALVWPVTG